MPTEYLMVLKLWKVFKAVGKRISAILSCWGKVTLFTHTLKEPHWSDVGLTKTCSLWSSWELSPKLQINCSLDYSPDLRRVSPSPRQLCGFHSLLPFTQQKLQWRQESAKDTHCRYNCPGPLPKSNEVLWSQMEILCSANFLLTLVINLLIFGEVHVGWFLPGSWSTLHSQGFTPKCDKWRVGQGCTHHLANWCRTGTCDRVTTNGPMVNSRGWIFCNDFRMIAPWALFSWESRGFLP